MPSFEKVFDQLLVDLADTPEEKARAEGYIEGKSYARKEMLCLLLFMASIAAIIYLKASP